VGVFQFGREPRFGLVLRGIYPQLTNVDRAAQGASHAQKASAGLSTMAEELQSLVGQFMV